jgi:hypothetical protein
MPDRGSGLTCSRMARAAARYGARVSGRPSARKRPGLIVPSVVGLWATIEAKRAVGFVATLTIDVVRCTRTRARDRATCTARCRAGATCASSCPASLPCLAIVGFPESSALTAARALGPANSWAATTARMRRSRFNGSATGDAGISRGGPFNIGRSISRRDALFLRPADAGRQGCEASPRFGRTTIVCSARRSSRKTTSAHSPLSAPDRPTS